MLASATALIRKLAAAASSAVDGGGGVIHALGRVWLRRRSPGEGGVPEQVLPTECGPVESVVGMCSHPWAVAVSGGERVTASDGRLQLTWFEATFFLMSS